MRIVILKEQEFDNYSKNHKYTSYYQTSSYGSLMSGHNLKPLYIGFCEGTELIGAALILYKNSFVGFKYGYAPRGILLDYLNYNHVFNITKELKSFLFKEKFILFKMDPLIEISKRDRNGNIINNNNHKENIIENLKKAGFYHCGFNNNFESIKPRWFAKLDLQNEEKELFKNLSKQTKNKIRKATKFGIEIYKDNDSLEKIYPFIAGKGKYSLKYYKDFQREFKNTFEIYIAKLNTEKFVENSRILYEKELEYNGYLNSIISRDGYKGKELKDILSKKIESDKLLIIYKEYLVQSIAALRDNPEGLIIAGAILIKENDSISLLIDGYDKMYKKFGAIHLTRWKIIKDYCKEYKYFNLNAITGNFNKENNKYYGLNEMKFTFNAEAYEYVGEFNLIVNSPMYTLYKNIVLEDSLKNINK